MSREPSKDDEYLLEQLAGLQERWAPIEKATEDEIDPDVALPVLEQASATLERIAKLERSETMARAAERTAELGRELTECEGLSQSSSVDRQLISKIGQSVLIIGVGAMLGSPIGGTHIAAALHQEVVGKVIEGAISGRNRGPGGRAHARGPQPVGAAAAG